MTQQDKKPRKRTRHNAEGSLRKRADGTWEGRYTEGFTADGKQIRKSVYAATRAACADKLKLKLAQTERGAMVMLSQGKLNFGSYLQAYLDSHTFGDSTTRRYQSATKMVARHPSGGVNLADLKAAHLEKLYRDLLGEYAASTVRHVRAYVNQALKQAVRHELMRTHPGLIAEYPRVREESPARAIPRDELARIFAELKSSRNFPAVAFIAALGLRHGEALGVQWGDIDFQKGQLHLARGLPQVGGYAVPGPLKTRKAARSLYLSDELVRLLKRQRRRLVDAGLPVEGEAWVFPNRFGGPQRQSVIREVWTSALKRAKVSHPYRIHDLRHSFISRLITEDGTDPRTAADLVGHTDPSMTLRLYAHSRDDQRRAAQIKAAAGFDELLVGVTQGYDDDEE